MQPDRIFISASCEDPEPEKFVAYIKEKTLLEYLQLMKEAPVYDPNDDYDRGFYCALQEVINKVKSM